MINKLTLLDTSAYRCIALCHNQNVWAVKTEGKRKIHEPENYRLRLRKIYQELTLEQLTQLYNIRKGY